jgi:hypothetical protein
MFPCVGDPTYLPRMLPNQPAATLTPTSDGVIVLATELPLTSALPEGVVAMLPDDSDLFRSHTAARWCDLRNQRWTDIGARDFSDFDIVNGNLVTLSIAGEKRLQQSWPLPPRDPKWPALGVAALCTSATWWVCARRYRRRTRLASVGAA